jgi:predicted ATP-binding protein involved in virulence
MTSVHRYIHGSVIDYDRSVSDAKKWADRLRERAERCGKLVDWKRFDEAAEFHQIAALRADKAKAARERMSKNSSS